MRPSEEPMKLILSLVLSAAITAGGVYGYLLFSSTAVPAKATLQARLNVTYPNDLPDGSLTQGQLEAIKATLTTRDAAYRTATLHLNCYPKSGTLPPDQQANFQFIIISSNGCTFESKRVYTTSRHLPRKIQETVQAAFSAMETVKTVPGRTEKVTF